jgi:DNA-3-methyladenine glycosylase II
MRFSRENIQAALKHLRKADPLIGAVIRDVGPFTLRLERNRFAMLVRSIISQQISTAAARSIRLRLEALVAPERLSAENILALTDEQLRSAGLSPQKLSYLRDLCGRVADGRLELTQIGRRSDEEVVAELIQVKGIGRWTAQMFLIFSLGRLDVFPHDDLGVRAAIRDLYGLRELPNKAASVEYGARWRPYASVASWYCWRLCDLKRKQPDWTAGYPV